MTKVIDSTVNNSFTFRLQFSYDGFEATQNLRGINPNIILDNIKKVINNLNNITFKHLNINIAFHNVLSMHLINKYGESDQYNSDFYNYLKELSDLGIYFNSINQNPNVNVIKQFSSGIEAPYNATSQEGKNLTNFFKKAEILGKDIDTHWWKDIIYHFNEMICLKSNLDMYGNLLHDSNNIKFSNVGCGLLGSYAIKIRYDGTLIHC
jgi:hypothetical protein